MGDTKGGPFDIDDGLAKQLLAQPNPDGRSNEDVVRPWINGSDITGRRRNMWIIDFPPGTTFEEAALYEAPFEYVNKNVKPLRIKSKREAYAKRWWLHMEPRPEMRAAILGLERTIVTSPRIKTQGVRCGWRTTLLPITRDDSICPRRRLFLRGTTLSGA